MIATSRLSSTLVRALDAVPDGDENARKPRTPPPGRENTSSSRERTRRKSKCLVSSANYCGDGWCVSALVTDPVEATPTTSSLEATESPTTGPSIMTIMTGQSGTAEPYLHLIPHAPSHHRPSLCGAGAERARGAQAQENVNSRFDEEVAEPSSSHRSPISSGVFIAGLW